MKYDTSYTRQAAERAARFDAVRERAAAVDPVASAASAPSDTLTAAKTRTGAFLGLLAGREGIGG